MKKGLFAKVLALVLIICLFVPTLALASFSAKVYSSSTTLRAKESTSSTKLDTLSKGTKVTVKSVNGRWAYVTYGSKTGYIEYKDLISLSHSQKAYVNADSTSIYKSASSSSSRITKASVNYPLYIVGENGSYYLVDDGNGKFTGYIPKSKVSTSKLSKSYIPSMYKVSYSKNGSSTSVPSSVKYSSYDTYATIQGADVLRKYLANNAVTMVGCRYNKAGGTYQYNNYSFVREAFKKIGYSVGSSISSIASVSSSAKITRRNLKVGDIVCLHCDEKAGTKVDHVGIYLGNGYFVHASPIAGCVVVSNLDNKYYKNAFLYGKRVIKDA